ncbi:hypothetical protein MHSWG343_06660 [Candidatus Mycoplasma haematohominis]|uniref:Uncharacterized protein n=1 Tax=Candidatus Mycoplasma haematohominis TaxID=1494318 RepID=A0A478FTJ8_9MOLU|nr:hypothetical protein MHSWG343_06660 [Candidatus Mycoplasma haemohominis]
MTPLKGAAVVGGGAALAASGGYGLSRLLADSMPSYVVLSEGAPITEGESTVGKAYGNYLIAPYGKKGNTNPTDASNKDKEDNEKWWTWSYKRWLYDFENKNKDNALSTEFQDKSKVGSAFSLTAVEDSKTKPLNQVCEGVYKKTKTDVSNNSDENKKKLWNNLWKYCSFFATKITTVEKNGDSYGNDVYGTTKKADLISVKDSNNDVFWNKRNEEFYSDKGDKKGKDASNGKFKDAYNNRDSNRRHIKEICEVAYDKSSSTDATNYPEGDVIKFCSIT